MKFHNMRTKWFGAVIAKFHLLNLKASNEIINIVLSTPNRRNLERLRLCLVRTCSDLEFYTPLLEHVDAVLNREFKDEFKYHFSRKNTTYDSSATKELFSLLEQAITHNHIGLEFAA